LPGIENFDSREETGSVLKRSLIEGPGTIVKNSSGVENILKVFV
jgi:hypothetical protein